MLSNVCELGAVSAVAIFARGFNVNGAGELSGTGSTVITTLRPTTLKGSDSPAGKLLKKSSPGTGGPALFSVPENPFPESTAEKSVKVPVDNGPASPITHPSYTHPAGSVGKVASAVGGIPGRPSHTPFVSLPLFALPAGSSVGVLKKKEPVAVEKSPGAGPKLVDILASLLLNSPARYFESAGAGSLSGLGSMVKINAVAASSASVATGNVV